MMSTAKNAFTTLSTIARAPSGFRMKPNSNGETHAE
uniref:Kch5 n=1 Tax=Arundo donax TaxID=35708 RepID=A0A0A9BHK3_ARUDO